MSRLGFVNVISLNLCFRNEGGPASNFLKLIWSRNAKKIETDLEEQALVWFFVL